MGKPPTPPGGGTLAKARDLHRRGKVHAAEQAYRRVLKRQPDHPDALGGLALLYLQAGAPGPAAECLKHQIAVAPNRAEAHNHLGLALKRLGDPAAAKACFDRAITLDPKRADAHANLGDILQDMGNLAAAIDAYGRAIAIDPRRVVAHHNLGLAHKASGQPELAVAAYRKALAIQPGLSVALSNLGNALGDLGRPDEAEQSLTQAIDADPNNAEAMNNLATLRLGAARFGEAAQLCNAALKIRPNQPQVLGNLSVALLALERADEAEAVIRRQISGQPNDPIAHTRLGLALRDQGRLDEAVDALETAITLDPEDIPAWEFLMHSARQLCDWSRVETAEKALFECLDRHPETGASPLALMCAEPPMSPSARSMGEILRTNADAYLARDGIVIAPKFKPKDAKKNPTDRPLRVGYLSADFGQHAVGSLVAPLFAAHDRRAVIPIGFPLTPSDGSPTALKIREALDGVHNLHGLDAAQAEAVIRAAKVDILVDLMGHTRHSRTDILARRPAPVQIGFLGFPGTVGGNLLDYIIMDPVVAPPGSDDFYAETVIRLPDSYFPPGADRIVADTPTRHAAGLPDNGFVFCCFNDTYKITRPVFGVWMDLLREIPASVLWLRHASDPVKTNLRRHAADLEVDGSRLIFAPRLADHGDHLARQRLADLFLDTRPYNAHTTASDALWVGLPVITCPGDIFPARVAASLLSAMGMEQLIATDLDHYRALALDLARHPNKLATIRANLTTRRNIAPLFNNDQFRRHLETAYQTFGTCGRRNRAG